MTNEREHPDQSAELWRSQALAQCAPSEFLSSLYLSFDNTMSRATTSFGTEAQVWVSAVALVVVVAAQLDAFHLLKRLSIDERFRGQLVAEAQKLTADIDEECAGRTSGCAALDVARAVAKARGATCDPAIPEPALTKCTIQASAALLSSPALDLWPDAPPGPRPPGPALDGWHPWTSLGSLYDWARAWAAQLAPKLPGILLSWILVSLGAPFWFDLLKNLFKLRSLLAQKDDADRGQRDTGTKPTATIEVNKGGGAGGPAPAAAPVTPPAAAIGRTAAALPEVDGEMGDLLATGAQG